MKNFNLIHEKWIFIKRLKSGFEQIAPFEITSQHDANPIVAFAWPRPDFDLASHEFLIGLLAAIYPIDPREPKQWTKLFHTPPSPDELAMAFDPFADAFVLDGDRPRFLQDFDALDGEELPIESLFIEAPGANTIELNADLFIKRGRARVLSGASAAIALYTLQQFAPSGGVGYRTSLRRGGPLVTLALPDGGKITRTTLWQRLWLNIPANLRLDPSAKSRAFPWLAPTRTSFADGPERKRDFLWRQDEKRRWFILSSRLPEDPHQLFEVESKPFAPILKKGNASHSRCARMPW